MLRGMDWHFMWPDVTFYVSLGDTVAETGCSSVQSVGESFCSAARVINKTLWLSCS